MITTPRTLLAIGIACSLGSASLASSQTVPARGSSAPSATSLAAMPNAVRAEVDRLVVDDAGKRATAAASLGEMGGAAISAVPWLAAVTYDTREVVSLSAGQTQVRALAAIALHQVGPRARDLLIARIGDTKLGTLERLQAASALSLMGDARAMGPVTALLRESLPSMPDGSRGYDLGGLIHWATYVAEGLACLPDTRVVAEFYLQVADIGITPGGSVTLREFKRLIDRMLGEPPFTSVQSARDWWAQNRGTAQLRAPAVCAQVQRGIQR